MIKLRREHLEALRRQAAREYPHECCGLLVGRIEADGRTRIIEELWPVANEFDGARLAAAFHGSEQAEGGAAAQPTHGAAAREERHRRMFIPPQAYLQAERRYAARGWGVVGNYHSHPEHPAVPSQFDLEHLAPWPTMSYVVISVRGGAAAEVRSWVLAADRSRFEEEEVLEGE